MIRLLLLAGLAFQAEIALLGDERPERRSEARATLVRAGEGAVPALRKALLAKDVEVRRGAAGVLDEIFRRVGLEGRRYGDYTVPRNRQTQRWRRTPVRVRGMQMNWLLVNPNQLERSSIHFRGVLTEWKDPSRGDYNYLLTELARRLEASDDGSLLEDVFVASALFWRLEQIEPFAEWTSRWAVRRFLLPALRNRMQRRGKRLALGEGDLYLRVLRYVAPLCDKVADAQRKRAIARLAGLGIR